jgi:hypothetical protein
MGMNALTLMVMPVLLGLPDLAELDALGLEVSKNRFDPCLAFEEGTLIGED